MKIKSPWLIISLFSFALCLHNCGKKPVDIEPPPGVDNQQFPETYPVDPPLRDIPTPAPIDPKR